MNVGTDSAPAGRRRTLLLHSGGAGVPPGGTTTPREELVDGGPRGLPEALRARPPKRGRRFPSRRQGETERQKARPGAVTTLRWRAERRHTFARRCDLRPNDALLGAPSPRFIRGYGKGPRRTRCRQEYGCGRLSGRNWATGLTRPMAHRPLTYRPMTRLTPWPA